MINITVSGNLVAQPKQVFRNTNGEIYGFRFGASTYKKVGPNFEKHTIWCSGLISKKKIENILSRLKKGTYIIASSCDATIREYQANNGDYRSELDLRFCQSLEAGNLPPVPESEQPAQQPQQPQNVPQNIKPQIQGTYDASQDPNLQQSIQKYQQQNVPRQNSAQQPNQIENLPF